MFCLLLGQSWPRLLASAERCYIHLSICHLLRGPSAVGQQNTYTALVWRTIQLERAAAGSWQIADLYYTPKSNRRFPSPLRSSPSSVEVLGASGNLRPKTSYRDNTTLAVLYLLSLSFLRYTCSWLQLLRLTQPSTIAEIFWLGLPTGNSQACTASAPMPAPDSRRLSAPAGEAPAAGDTSPPLFPMPRGADEAAPLGELHPWDMLPRPAEGGGALLWGVTAAAEAGAEATAEADTGDVTAGAEAGAGEELRERPKRAKRSSAKTPIKPPLSAPLAPLAAMPAASTSRERTSQLTPRGVADGAPGGISPSSPGASLP